MFLALPPTLVSVEASASAAGGAGTRQGVAEGASAAAAVSLGAREDVPEGTPAAAAGDGAAEGAWVEEGARVDL